MLRQRILIIIAMIAIGLCTSCNRKPNNKQNQNHPKQIAILKLGSHALIDEVETSVFRSLKDRYGGRVAISVYNANFENDLLHQSVNQIASSGYDVVVPITTSASIAMVNAAPPSMPVVFSFVSNPSSLWGQTGNRPANVTGTSDQIDYEKNIRLIVMLFSKVSKIGYLVNESEEQAKIGLEEVKKIAPRFGLKIIPAPVATSADVATAARSIVDQVDVFLIGGDNTVVSGVGGLLSVADRRNIPVFAVERTSVEKGCIAAYGIDYKDLGEKTASLVIDVIEGKSTSSLPVVYYKETRLYVNRVAFDKAKVPIPKDVYYIY